MTTPRLEVGGIKDLEFAVCRTCKNVNSLVTGFKEVVGVIGADIDNYQLEENSLYVSLWNPVTWEGRSADIDILEIKKSDRKIDYDVAIISVINHLYRDNSMPRERIKKIKVIIRGDTPVSDDTIEFLRKKMGEVVFS